MLESTNPEIDVRELMAKVRAEVQRRQAAGALSPVPRPSLLDSLESQVAEAIREARQKHKVDPRVPKFVHGLVRDQGAVNIRLIHVVERLAEQLVVLRAGQMKMESEMLQQRQADQMQRQASQNEIATLMGEISLQRQVMTRLLDELKLQHAGTAGAPLAARASEIQRHCLDAFYSAFESRYRGSREEIKKRLRVYLPYVTQTDAGTVAKPILDLGCGRGEWLELLKENGCAARGVDMNIPALAACNELGLQVIESDAIAYLRSLPDRSVGMVTGFHIIEHLPLPLLLELMSEVYRVLQAGGLVVLESPNPANIRVGACSFYLDPTHRRPLPSGLTEFIVEYAGFRDLQALFLQPVEESSHVGPADSPVAQRFNECFSGPQDYAVIGTKPVTVAVGRGADQTQADA
ncbi:MAG: methyltransferase domain-containing protein [Verrucomicrobia bacterium]|nr:methyltransferase domain-containing protein [Verrucomicrobiota bacterium]